MNNSTLPFSTRTWNQRKPIDSCRRISGKATRERKMMRHWRGWRRDSGKPSPATSTCCARLHCQNSSSFDYRFKFNFEGRVPWKLGELGGRGLRRREGVGVLGVNEGWQWSLLEQLRECSDVGEYSSTCTNSVPPPNLSYPSPASPTHPPSCLYVRQQLPKLQTYIINKMKIKNLAKLFSRKPVAPSSPSTAASSLPHYRPTPYLAHPFLQSVFNISEPLFPFQFKREKIFFDDGGHISLDWLPPALESKNPPVLFVMHGLTGGSEMNYIKELMKPASEEGYCCVCLNSRGINNEMTSPMPFTAMKYGELEAAFQRVATYYPESQIFLVGTSFGGNYLMRYLLRQQRISNIKGLVVLAPPINVTKVVDEMGSVYQRFFVKRYIQETVFRHEKMMFWEEVGLVDMAQVKKSQNLMDFHTHLTAKIVGYPSAREIFQEYSISDEEMSKLNVKTLMMLSKDDPIVSYTSMPFDSIKSNPMIELYTTERGGHLCWFEGIKPKRWYPKPVLQYLRTLRTDLIV